MQERRPSGLFALAGVEQCYDHGVLCTGCSKGADCPESIPQPFYMVIRRPEWGRQWGLLAPPAQSSQQPLSQVPANRLTCLWSQSGLSGDREPFPRLIGVRGAKNFTLFFLGLFKAGYKPLVFLLLLWVCFSASFFFFFLFCPPRWC